jgi:hypothetical protein
VSRLGLLFWPLFLIPSALLWHAGGWWRLGLWPVGVYAWVAVLYTGGGGRLLGKSEAGDCDRVDVVALLPFLAPLWLLWHAVRLVSREPVWNELAPGLRIGRRVLPHELPPDTALVVDLTAEFGEPAGVRAGRRYLALPILDGTWPHPCNDHLAEQIERIAADPGPVYIHCALGHGRTGTLAAAVLLARGLATDPEDSVAQVRAARPGVRLKAVQRRFLDDWHRRRLSPPRTSP